MGPWSHERPSDRRLRCPAMLGWPMPALVLCSLLILASPVLAAETAPVPSAPVVVDGDTLFRVRGVTAFPADERAEAIADRIVQAAANRWVPTSSLRVVDSGRSSDVMIGDTVLLSVTEAD